MCDLSGCSAGAAGAATGGGGEGARLGGRRLAQAGAGGVLVVRFSGATFDAVGLSSMLEAEAPPQPQTLDTEPYTLHLAHQKTNFTTQMLLHY